MKDMNRRRFLKGGLSMLAITPLTPLIPSTGIPTNVGVPLPYATLPPPNGLASPIPGTASSIAYLGVAGPQSGDQSVLYQQLEQGVRGAISDQNNLQGQFYRTFDLHTFDDLGNSSNAQVAAGSMIADPGVLLAIGHLGNATTDNALSVYAHAQMPIIVPAATGDAITGHGFRNVFRLATKDSLEGQLFARYLYKKRGHTRFGVISTDDGYGPAVARAFESEIHAQKAAVASIAVPTLIDDAGIDALVAKIVQATPDLVFFAGTPERLGRTFEKLIAAGYHGKIAASQGFWSSDTITRFGQSAEDLLVSTSMPPLNHSAAQRMEIQTYNETYGQMTPIAAFSYAAAQIAIAAITRIGAVSRAPIIQAIANGGTFSTIVGDFRFDAFGDPADPNLYFYTVKKGAWVSAGSLRPSQFT